MQDKKSILFVPMAFGEQLKAWRKRAYLTQQGLAKAAEVNVSYISNLERNVAPNTRSGKPRPSEDLCERLAKALNVSLDEVRTAAGYLPSVGVREQPRFDKPSDLDAPIYLCRRVHIKRPQNST